MSSLREDLALVRDQRFAVLLLARTISVLGSAFAPVALAFGILHLPGASAATLSIVLACESVPMVVFLLLGGVIADRLPRARLLMTADLLGCVAFAALGLMLGTGHAPVWLMGLAAAASGTGMALLWPALTGLIPEVVPPDRLQAGNALLSMVANTSRILGVVLGGLVVALIGAPWALGCTAVLFAVAAVLITRLRTASEDADRDQLSAGGALRDLREGWHEFASREWLWVVVAQFSVLVMMLQATYGVLGPVLAHDDLGGARAWSWVLAADAVGMLLGVLIAMRLRPRHPILVSVLVMVVGGPVTPLLMGLGCPLWSVILASVATGATFEFFGVLWNTTMQREVPPEALSRVSSYDAMGSLMFGPLGLLCAGPAIELVGVHHALVGCAVVLVLVSAAGLASPGVRHLTWHDPLPDEPALPHVVDPLP